MNLRRTTIIGLFAAVHLPVALACDIDPAILLNRPYAEARATLIAAGWTPKPRVEQTGWGKALQDKYPELDGCAVDRPACSFSFAKERGPCIRVVTVGEQIDALVVRSAAFDCTR